MLRKDCLYLRVCVYHCQSYIHIAQSHTASLLRWMCWVVVEQVRLKSETTAAESRVSEAGCPIQSCRSSGLQQRRLDDRRYWLLSRWRGTDGWYRLAESRLAMSETGVQQSDRYLGALLCRQRCTVTLILFVLDTFRNVTPMQIVVQESCK